MSSMVAQQLHSNAIILGKMFTHGSQCFETVIVHVIWLILVFTPNISRLFQDVQVCSTGYVFVTARFQSLHSSSNKTKAKVRYNCCNCKHQTAPLLSMWYTCMQSKARFPLLELTARADGWPVSITPQHGPCWRVRISTSRVDGPSTRVVETGL